MNALRPLRAALIAGAVAGLGGIIALQTVTTAAREGLDQTLLLTQRSIEAEVERLRPLPLIAAEDARIRLALTGSGPVDAANRYLARVSNHAGAADIFLMNAEGLTIAASNWEQPDSFVGETYAFRPYFQEAMATGSGRFYAIGVTTGVPGYFLSTRVQVGSETGVLAVKLDLRPLQETWRAAGVDVALADADGIVFLSGRPDWQYRPLHPLAPEVLARLARTRAYDRVGLASAAPLAGEGTDAHDLTGADWTARRMAYPGTGWTVIAATSTRRLWLVAGGWAILCGVLALAALGAMQGIEQRRQILALRLSQSARLEAMVTARTEELAHEVEARRQAEADLRSAQEALIHTEKIAALGRMSTAIVHEISQPLAAMEATLTAAELGLSGEASATRTRLDTARGLIRRMQRTTRHLKSFGRKEQGQLVLVDLRQPLTSAVELVTPRARAVGVIPALELPASPVRVRAGPVRIEQVVVNLLLNALDAVENRPGAAITLFLGVSDGRALIRLTDTGAGIAPGDLDRIEEPFFSTKTSGEGLGLGLGLSICRAIVTDFGGTLAIASREGEGTEVSVTFPLVPAHAEVVG